MGAEGAKTQAIICKRPYLSGQWTEQSLGKEQARYRSLTSTRVYSLYSGFYLLGNFLREGKLLCWKL